MPVFRLQKDSLQHGLANTIQHWGISNMYDDKQIDAIESSNKSSLSEPTSIPSPFARIALAKTAFGEVAEHGENALSSYQKIVSDSLDVAEIFFTYDKWKSRIDIIKWDSQNDLQKLATHHKQLYKTLSTFLRDDSSVYNFDKMKCIYILKNRETGEMIGATSPSTLFFSSANQLTGVPIQLSNNHNAFSEILPLHQRSWEFQKYLYTWIAINKRPIGTLYNFNEFYKYLESEKKLSPDKLEEIGVLLELNTESSLSENYSPFEGNLSPEILGSPLYKQSININQIDSDFKINSKFTIAKSPLVLPLEGGNGTRYASWKLTENTLWANFKADINLSRETLPDGTLYPWLTINDFLEDSIIKLPYEIKRESFFDGNLTEGSLNSYLLPIKEKYFQYFDTDDLKNHITIKESGNVISVELKIPVLKGTIDFKKEYRTSENQIISARFDCAIFPNVKFSEDKEAFYRFGLVYAFNEKEKFDAKFLKINSKIEDNSLRTSIRNESSLNNMQCKNFSLEGTNFDYLSINYGNIQGVIIPEFQKRNGNAEFSFAIDFGTTNTHIEYKVRDRMEIKTFDILSNDRQIHWFHGGEDVLRYAFEEEYIPEFTGVEFSFPMRSALSFSKNTNWSDVYPFEKASIDELYEKRMNYPYNSVITDLKWSGDSENKNQVAAYIQSIMFILRNKVVLNNGSLKSTVIKWFYPVSMEKSRYDNLKRTWIDAYKKYFGGPEENIISITESVAPFEYFVRDGNANNIVSIDIGGGTTDLLIARGRDVDYITSFKFAANSIFGDGYSENNNSRNGIIRQFANQIKEELLTEIDENDDLFRIFEEMESNRSSSDIASFLFSLQKNKKVLDTGENLAKNTNLSRKLKDDSSQKITFIFFYSAIIYHLAKIIKAKDLKIPDKIVFSGNGSRAISFLTEDESVLKGYTKWIFEKVIGKNIFSENNRNRLEIIINKENPKESTCKGGLLAQNAEAFDEILQKRIVLHSSDTSSVINFKEEDFKQRRSFDTYSAINDDYLKATEDEARVFIDLVFDSLSFFHSRGYQLNNRSIEIAKDVCYSKLDVYTKNGWNKKENEVTKDEVIEETLFFYPLIGMLKDLGNAIANENI